MKTAQIGASGVLLIQYQLLKRGIDSAPMTTDDGIDLVVYAPQLKEKAVTVQVKTCLRPKPAGGRGKLGLDWWLRSDSPAEVVGLVNLDADSAWLFRHDEFVEKAQQKPEGRLHLYFYTDETRIIPHALGNDLRVATPPPAPSLKGRGKQVADPACFLPP